MRKSGRRATLKEKAAIDAAGYNPEFYWVVKDTYKELIIRSRKRGTLTIIEKK